MSQRSTGVAQSRGGDNGYEFITPRVHVGLDGARQVKGGGQGLRAPAEGLSRVFDVTGYSQVFVVELPQLASGFLWRNGANVR